MVARVEIIKIIVDLFDRFTAAVRINKTWNIKNILKKVTYTYYISKVNSKMWVFAVLHANAWIELSSLFQLQGKCICIAPFFIHKIFTPESTHSSQHSTMSYHTHTFTHHK